MKKTFTHLLLLLLLSAMSSQLFAASTVEVNGIYFDAKTGDVTGAKTLSDGILNIPESITVDGKKISVTNITVQAFEGRTDIREVNLPLSLENIEGSAFKDCRSLKSIVIPDNVITIGSLTFMGCTKLNSISFSDKLRTIPYGCCWKCISLKKIKFPKKLKTIDIQAFRACESLTEVVLPDQLETIKDMAFSLCTRLTKVVIPESVKEIGICCFGGCPRLKSFVFLGTEPPTMINTFKDVEKISFGNESDGIFADPDDELPGSTITNNATMYVPTGSEDTYKNDPEWGKIKNVNTAIENIVFINAEAGIKNIFDISGRKQSSLKSGINIIVNSNGKIKKIIR